MINTIERVVEADAFPQLPQEQEVQVNYGRTTSSIMRDANVSIIYPLSREVLEKIIEREAGKKGVAQIKVDLGRGKFFQGAEASLGNGEREIGLKEALYLLKELQESQADLLAGIEQISLVGIKDRSFKGGVLALIRKDESRFELGVLRKDDVISHSTKERALCPRVKTSQLK